MTAAVHIMFPTTRRSYCGWRIGYTDLYATSPCSFFEVCPHCELAYRFEKCSSHVLAEFFRRPYKQIDFGPNVQSRYAKIITRMPWAALQIGFARSCMERICAEMMAAKSVREVVDIYQGMHTMMELASHDRA